MGKDKIADAATAGEAIAFAIERALYWVQMLDMLRTADCRYEDVCLARQNFVDAANRALLWAKRELADG